MIIHLKKSGLSRNENKSQEGIEGMSTSGKNKIFSEALTDNGNVARAKTTNPFDMICLKPLIDSNKRGIK